MNNSNNVEKNSGGVAVSSLESHGHGSEVDHAAMPRFVRLQTACAFASRNFGNEILRADLKEASDYFRRLASGESEEAAESPAMIWKKTGQKRFAINSENLQMTEEGLRIAMYQIPRSERKGLLKFKWTRRYRDGTGKQWLEFEAT